MNTIFVYTYNIVHVSFKFKAGHVNKLAVERFKE